MNGKLYILGAPPCIFSGLTPELQQRMEYVDNFLHFPQEKWKQLTHALLVGRLPLPRPVLYTWFSRKGLDHLLQATAADRVLLYEDTTGHPVPAPCRHPLLHLLLQSHPQHLPSPRSGAGRHCPAGLPAEYVRPGRCRPVWSDADRTIFPLPRRPPAGRKNRLLLLWPAQGPGRRAGAVATAARRQRLEMPVHHSNV